MHRNLTDILECSRYKQQHGSTTMSSQFQKDRGQDTLLRFVAFIAIHARHNVLMLKQPQISTGPVTNTKFHISSHKHKSPQVQSRTQIFHRSSHKQGSCNLLLDQEHLSTLSVLQQCASALHVTGLVETMFR